MKVRIKNFNEQIHDVLAWSCQTVPNKSFIDKLEIVPVVIVLIKNTKTVKIVPVTDIEEIER